MTSHPTHLKFFIMLERLISLCKNSIKYSPIFYNLVVFTQKNKKLKELNLSVATVSVENVITC